MRFPVVDCQFVVDEQPHAVVRRGVKPVVVFVLGNEISGPAHREMIDGRAFRETSRAPSEIDPLVGTGKRRRTLEFRVRKILAPESGLSTNSGYELGFLD